MPFIGQQPAIGRFQLLDSITTSATDTFALTLNGTAFSPGSATNLVVSLNGLTQAPEAAYTISGTNIVFDSALTASDVIDYILVLGDVNNIGVPSGGSVGTSQLAGSLNLSSKTVTFANDQISGDKIDGGIISDFQSTGIDDNASSTAITVNANGSITTGDLYFSTGASLTSSGVNSSLQGSAGNTGAMALYGGPDYNSGSGIAVYGESHSSQADKIRFFTSGFTERMVIDANGKVGIGTSTPVKPLTIEAAGEAPLNIKRTGVGSSAWGGGVSLGTDWSNTGIVLYGSAAGQFTVSQTSNTAALNPSGEGYTQILTGTTSSVNITGDLFVNGGDAYIGQDDSVVGNLTLYGPASGNEGAQLNFHPTGDYTGTFAIDVYQERLRCLNSLTNGTFQWYTAGNAAVGMEMASDGELRCHKGVLIDGQDSGSGVDLHIQGNNPEIKFEETDGETWWIHCNGSSFYILQDKNGDQAWTSPHPLRFHSDETVDIYDEFRLESDGDLHIDGNVVAYSTTVSDKRLKDNVQTIQGALDKVMSLRGVAYDWNAGPREGERDYGLIAQECENVIPEIVREKNMPFIGDGDTTYKTVDYEKLTAVLIEAVKEQQAQIKELKEMINGTS